jgi:hypothetical protein
VRYLLLRLAERDDERLVEVELALRELGFRQTEAQMALRLAAGRWGDLKALLVGVPDDLLDRPPSDGEWTLRQILGHLLSVERRYLLQSRYAAERLSDLSLPIRLPESRLPAAEGEPMPTGGLSDLLAVLEGARAETSRDLATLSNEVLGAPTIWAGWTVDLRFRLHRFGAHLRQHAVHLAKSLSSLGWRPTEAQAILGEAERARARLEGALVGVPDLLVERAPAPGLEAIGDVLTKAAAEESATVAAVSDALGA